MAGNGEQLLLTVDEAVQRSRIGRTRIFELIKAGEIRSVKIGRSRRIPVRALEEYVDTLLNGEKAA